MGKTPQEAINQVQEWQNTSASQLLKSGTSTGGTGTSGAIGTRVTSIGELQQQVVILIKVIDFILNKLNNKVIFYIVLKSDKKL